MSFIFVKVEHRSSASTGLKNTFFLFSDNWDDFGFKTTFTLSFYNSSGSLVTVGNVKIGFMGQQDGWTFDKIPESFTKLDENFYSLGQDPEYYSNLVTHLEPEERKEILIALGDVVFSEEKLTIAQDELAFNTSLTRNINKTTIDHQYKRILNGDAPLTPYEFSFWKPGTEKFAELKLDFEVRPNSKPSSNIHILIGRNGVGKTTILNNMVEAFFADTSTSINAGYYSPKAVWYNKTLENSDFAGVVSVSFSAFDTFEPPPNRDNPDQGMRYRYVGLKKNTQNTQHNTWPLKSKLELCSELSKSLSICLALHAKRDRWLAAIQKLESDYNFKEMNLSHLLQEFMGDLSEEKKDFQLHSTSLFNSMSSGHTIVLLSITQLIETVEERTLVLIDEPESHLHPPLLSAFTRALAELLTNRNAVAIIATHSPVVLQEVPKSCVSIIDRSRLAASVAPPESETFGENVGTLTRHVFGLQVINSGFHDLLRNEVKSGKSYEQIETDYSGQIGYEGKALLRSLTIARENGSEY